MPQPNPQPEAESLQWFEDESIWQATYPFLFSEASFQTAAAEIQKIVALTGCASGAPVLDLCCGPGRHAIPFAKSGFNVTGVDRSAFLLSKAKSYAEREQVSITWMQEDMRRFQQPKSRWYVGNGNERQGKIGEDLSADRLYGPTQRRCAL
jgi:2-polyprenyl-3-methyl-5-hydroxy-6-metoxy-1,4-benzoquinol methylase